MNKFKGFLMMTPFGLILLFVVSIICICIFQQPVQLISFFLMLVLVIGGSTILAGKGADILFPKKEEVHPLAKSIKELDDVILNIQNKGYNSAILLLNAIKKDLSAVKRVKPNERYIRCRNSIRCDKDLQKCPLNSSCKDFLPSN